MNMYTPIAPPPIEAKRRLRLTRRSLSAVPLGRYLRGGRIDDGGRLPRYLLVFLLALAMIWGPVAGYLLFAPKRYSSELSLILPGAGASASINLSDIGQASSYADSPYASSAISPTVTYQRLLDANRVLAAAGERLGLSAAAFGHPRIRLIDQTSLILVEMTAESPAAAQARAQALLDAFLAELDGLRSDEIQRREASSQAAIESYRRSVAETRAAITALQQQSGLVSVQQYSGMVADMEALATHLRNLEAELTLRQGSVDALMRALDLSPEQASAILQLQTDAEYRALAASMAEHLAEVAAVRGQYGLNHPTLVAAEEAYYGARSRALARAGAVTGLAPEILDTKAALSSEGQRGALLADLVTQAAERDGLEAEHAALYVRHAQLRERVLSLVGPASRLDDMQRDYQVAEAVFASALARNDTSKSDLYASYPLVQVLERPSLPDGASSPRAMVALAAGVAASFCVVVALLLGWLRRPLVDRLLKAKGEA